MKSSLFIPLLLLLCVGCSTLEDLEGNIDPDFGAHAVRLEQLVADNNSARPVMRAAALPRAVTASWDYPLAQETPDLTFTFYHSADLTVPLRSWSVFTNVPGNQRRATWRADKLRDFYVLTASNYLGESEYSK